MTKETRVMEERKEKVGGSIMKVARNREQVEGRAGAEKERGGREEKTGGRRKARCDDRENVGNNTERGVNQYLQFNKFSFHNQIYICYFS